MIAGGRPRATGRGLARFARRPAQVRHRMRQQLGPYRILHTLGEGGMGVVYAAEDSRLGRAVALKTVRAEIADDEARERLRREARAAAAISHPNVCQLYEIGEHEGELFIAMELLEGEALAARIARGALPVADAVRIGLDVLAALGALHRRGVLHRDLKPSNIFITEHGAKLLDFGIARVVAEEGQRTLLTLTGKDVVLGTPRYMAPEHASGDPIDARSDLFAFGAVLYEMLAGRPAFDGPTPVRVLHALMYEQPPALTGSPLIASVDRVVHRALAKSPSLRYASADDFAADLRGASDATVTATTVRARPLSRLIVLPFRLLRADPDVDFLGFSLADAVTTSLSGVGSLIVRSSMAAARLASDLPDLQTIARDADVDAVLSGTLLRAGSQVRLSAQLVEAPGGAVLWSHTMQVGMDDIFQLHDKMVHELVAALSIQLTAHEHRLLGRDVPANARAYEFYLRGNEVAKEADGWRMAVDLYEQCVALDPQYAPAWARLGRVYRLLAKYRDDEQDLNRARAEQALTRALELNPDLSIAHHVIAQMEVEGGRAIEAMVRLLRLAASSHDPELFAGLCHVCRYCGLLDASVAAHDHARRLDPRVATSVVNTYFHLREYERVLAAHDKGAPYLDAMALAELGRVDEALALLRRVGQTAPPRMRDFMEVAVILLEGGGIDPDALATLENGFFRFVTDPEGLYYASRHLARLGETHVALREFLRAVDGGYFCYPAYVADSWLDNLRGSADFAAALEKARVSHLDAAKAFRDADGERIVGVRLAAS
jgi:serine/threonine protein kinase/tetratricopeptide (TPR) repeat protein